MDEIRFTMDRTPAALVLLGLNCTFDGIDKVRVPGDAEKRTWHETLHQCFGKQAAPPRATAPDNAASSDDDPRRPVAVTIDLFGVHDGLIIAEDTDGSRTDGRVVDLWTVAVRKWAARLASLENNVAYANVWKQLTDNRLTKKKALYGWARRGHRLERLELLRRLSQLRDGRGRIAPRKWPALQDMLVQPLTRLWGDLSKDTRRPVWFVGVPVVVFARVARSAFALERGGPAEVFEAMQECLGSLRQDDQIKAQCKFRMGEKAPRDNKWTDATPIVRAVYMAHGFYNFVFVLDSPTYPCVQLIGEYVRGSGARGSDRRQDSHEGAGEWSGYIAETSTLVGCPAQYGDDLSWADVLLGPGGTVPGLDVSIMLKVLPGFDNEETWRAIRHLARSLDFGSVHICPGHGATGSEACPMPGARNVSQGYLSARQGFYDVIVTLMGCTSVAALQRFIYILGNLAPCITESATILRLDVDDDLPSHCGRTACRA